MKLDANEFGAELAQIIKIAMKKEGAPAAARLDALEARLAAIETALSFVSQHLMAEGDQ